VEGVIPLVRRVNDLLFDGIKKEELMIVMRVMRQLTYNSEHAVASVRAQVLKRDRQKGALQRGGRARKAFHPRS
jgi:hypothetical protein